MWAYVAVLNGEPIAVAGVFRDKYMVAFSQMKDEMRGRKKDIVRLAHANMAAIKARGVKVIAFASDEPTSLSLIKHLGFVYEGHTELGEAYSCQAA
jgi:hypothetical protein